MIFSKNKHDKLSDELFKNPTAEYRGLPFWSWNCRLNKKMIDEQLEIFKEMGFGGIVIHPREGLDTEYLGTEFMDMVKHTVKRCREMGLVCWLYDDDRFPSGAADGLVTKNPQFRARQLRLTKERLNSGYCASEQEFNEAINRGCIPNGYYCTAYFIEIKNKKLAQYHRLKTAEEISSAIKNGGDVWFAYLELDVEAEWFEGQTYSDTMNPAAVEEFIKITHERYKNTLGDDFGTAASAIFTDEPRIGKQRPLHTAASDNDVLVPYTEYVRKQFSAKYGFDVLDIIPEYVWDRADANMSNRYLYHHMITECFASVFMDKICTWCRKNGILMTGHILGEETLHSQTTTVGDAMRTYKNMDIPGIDILIDNRELTTVKQAASVAVQYGREAVMSELYGVTNWDCTFKTYKLQGDWQAALGITIRIPHLSHMSLEGEAKRDWPGSIFYQAPWYKEFPYIEDHFARLNTVLTRGTRVTRIAVISPVESMWVKSGSDDVTKKVRNQLDHDFAELAGWLLYSTLDFDYLSESLLQEQCTDYNSGKQLKVGNSSYDAVIVPGLITIRGTTLDILERFAENNGKVIFMGNIPQLVYGSESERVSDILNKCMSIPKEKMRLIDELEYLRDVEIRYGKESPADNLFYQLREDNICKWLFICHVNQKNSNCKEKYTIKVKGNYSLVLYDTISGERFSIPFQLENGYTVFEWNCYSEDSILLCLTNTKTQLQQYKLVTEYTTIQKIKKVKHFSRTEPNVLLLDYARYSINNGEIHKYEQILRIDNKIRKQLGFFERTGMDRQPWATEEKETHNITLYYDIYSEIDTSVQLGIENPQKCRILLNGIEADNTITEWYVDKAIKVVHLPDMQKGKNELKIERLYHQKNTLENIYLLGEFNVRLDERQAIITEQCDNLEFGNITNQGMPFYTGNLEYSFDLDIDANNEYFIRIPKFIAPVIGVYVDNKKKGLIAYTPHRLSLGKLDCGRHKIKVILYGNRFNAFGMLHNANQNYVWYGNSSYRTTGNEWTDYYMTRPVGIMSGIEIETKLKMEF